MKPGIYLEEALKDVLSTSNFVHGMFNLKASKNHRCITYTTVASFTAHLKLSLENFLFQKLPK